METFYSHGFAAIAVVCLAVLFLGGWRRKNTILMFVQRGMIGFLAITGLNSLFAGLTIQLFVGINIWTLLTCAILGIPGVCMLFCLSFF